MGIIVDVYPDRKERVHTVFVEVKSGLIKRPIHKLYVISQVNESNTQP